MLVFTRKPGESLIVGDNVEITVLSVNRDHVRIGINAPREIPVHRREVYEAIVRQNQLASQSVMPSSELLSRLKEKQ